MRNERKLTQNRPLRLNVAFMPPLYGELPAYPAGCSLSSTSATDGLPAWGSFNSLVLTCLIILDLLVT